MKNLLLFICFYLSLNLVPAQSQGNEPCGFDELLRWRIHNIPGYQQRFDALQLRIRNHVPANFPVVASSDYTIPVVVHVIHKVSDGYGVRSNISYEQIQWQMNALNAAFAADYPNYTHELNGPYAVNTGIKFCLATNPTPGTTQWARNPAGQPECGVMRYSRANNDIIHKIDMDNELGLLLAATHPPGAFPFNMYLNIWLVSDICDPNPGSPCDEVINPTPGIVGFGTMPPLTANTLDGIVFRYDCFGDNTLPGNNFSLFS